MEKERGLWDRCMVSKEAALSLVATWPPNVWKSGCGMQQMYPPTPRLDVCRLASRAEGMVVCFRMGMQMGMMGQMGKGGGPQVPLLVVHDSEF